MLNKKSYNDICRQVVDRDEKVISVLYDNYGAALNGVITRIVNDENVALEVLQDTFTKIWSKGHQYDPDQSRLYTWMMRIARNAAINYIHSKSAKSKKNIHSYDNVVYLNDQSREADQLELMDMRQSLEKLEEKYQTILELVYYKGYTHQEVSDEYNLPLGTVKSRIKIGLRELKKIYDYRLMQILLLFMLTNNYY